MTVKEISDLLTLLQVEYPQSFLKLDERQMAAKINLWAKEFEADDSTLVYTAARCLMKSGREFAPGIGQIREKMRQLTEPDALTESAAWALVSRACANGLYGYQAEFAKLPPAVQDAVGRPEQLREWAAMDAETVQSVVASNFMRSYRAGVQREKDRAALPERVKELLDDMAGKMALPEEAQKENDDES